MIMVRNRTRASSTVL